MPNDLTLGQLQQLNTWSEKRDFMINEIRRLTIELDYVSSACKNEGLALADLHKSIAEANGRISELNKQEERLKNSHSHDVSNLIVRKSQLETEIEAKKSELELIEKSKNQSIELINKFIEFYDGYFTKLAEMQSIVDNIIKGSQNKALSISELLDKVKKHSDEIIDVNQKNVIETNRVLEKLPAMLVELQKHKLVTHKL